VSERIADEMENRETRESESEREERELEKTRESEKLTLGVGGIYQQIPRESLHALSSRLGQLFPLQEEANLRELRGGGGGLSITPPTHTTPTTLTHICTQYAYAHSTQIHVFP
jgi:hypothetical protein